MADFSISTEELRAAARELDRAASFAAPHHRQLAVDLSALGSDEVFGALSATTAQQEARARKLAERFTSLADALETASSAIVEQDEALADRFAD
jgi:hypothetical protein